MATFAPSFLIGSFSFSQVTRTTNKSGQSLHFGHICPRAAELRPFIDVRNCFFWLNILRMDGKSLKFCINININKFYVGIVDRYFSQICNGVTALDWCQKLVFAQYLEKGWTEFNQILCTHYHWQVLCWFCKLLLFANLQQSYGPWFMLEMGFGQYLENGWTEFNQTLCLHYHWHDLSAISSSNRVVLLNISLSSDSAMAGYDQILWQF